MMEGPACHLGRWWTVWATLLVVLLSAAPTGPQVQLRLIGSAFDPASSTVVVSPKRQQHNIGSLSQGARDRRDDGDKASFARDADRHSPFAAPLLLPATLPGAGDPVWFRFSTAERPAKARSRPQAARPPPSD
jgi:hypothetical protein